MKLVRQFLEAFFLLYYQHFFFFSSCLVDETAVCPRHCFFFLCVKECKW